MVGDHAHSGDRWAETNARVDAFLQETVVGAVPSGTIYAEGRKRGFTSKMIECGRDRNSIHYEKIGGRWLWFEPPGWASERAAKGHEDPPPVVEPRVPHSGPRCEHPTPVPNIIDRRADGLVMCVLCDLPVPLRRRDVALVR
ncbi:hypothetical protein TPB0596_33830 [Tsukamurella pulmonis]|nr:hypothetical protein TPB0596_33830 [Tsukamurella pulmonis]